jgi:hypothetical protein
MPVEQALGGSVDLAGVAAGARGRHPTAGGGPRRLTRVGAQVDELSGQSPRSLSGRRHFGLGMEEAG